jgi:hypothetical protein
MRREDVMKATKLILSGAALMVLAAPAAFAQSSTTDEKPQTIQQRKENQQDRIAQGVQSGQLTAGETKNLETKEAGLNREERTMRSEDNGHLTAADRATLNNQQNRLSNRIYDDKHNGAVQHNGTGEIGQRKENQQDRIAQGIKSGQLTPAETAKLEKQQQGINREEAGMREANGGKLTQADKKAVNQQQNQASRKIYNNKHNGRRQ